MKRNYIAEVIALFFRNEYPRETEEKVQQWMLENESVPEQQDAVRSYWDSLYVPAGNRTRRSLDCVKKKLGFPSPKESVFTRSWRLRAAAVLLPLCLLAGGYFCWNNLSGKTRMVSVHVPDGSHRKVELPDGSTVWINAGSTLRYPASFDGTIRKVRLEGEAFFTVARNPAVPFVVETEKLSVNVVGTTFNVSAYAGEEKTTATLNSGKVEVRTSSSRTFTLEPSQQLSFDNRSNRADIRSVPDEVLAGWMSGNLIFEYKPLTEIFRALERKYGVTFEAGKALPGITGRYSVKFVHQENIEEVMQVLKDICGFTYVIEGKTIRIRE